MIGLLKKIAFDLKIKAGYTAVFILLLVSYLITIYSNNQLKKQIGWVTHSNKVIENMELLVSGMKDAETGLRGYINTKDTAFLEPYKNSLGMVNSSFTALQREARNDDRHQQSLNILNKLIRKRYDELAFAIQEFPRGNYIITDTLLRSFYVGKVSMDRIRTNVATMQQHEKNVLATRNKELKSLYVALDTINITSLFLALVLIAFGFYTYRIENKAKLVAVKKADDYQIELQQRIAELDKANKELIQMKSTEKFAATGRIARTIAHEVRNPLTNIDLAIAQLKNDISEQDENSDLFFEIVTRNSQRINELISELLYATRFAELNYIPVSINTLLDETLALAKDSVELRHVKVEKNYSTDICDIDADPEKVKIAFLNIIVNAIEAMEPRKGILQIHTKGEDNKCVVEITDNGAGMTEEQLNNLFEPYFTTKPDGNGLGLTNTQNIILNHGGTIYVSSKPGKGTNFVIKFDFSGNGKPV